MTTFEKRAMVSLDRIANALEVLASALVSVEEPEAPAEGCLHPDELRVNLGDEWECGICRYRHALEVVTA